MKTDRIIKITNRIAMLAIVLLVYWIFIFVTIQVFGLKVFRENITESFYFSIMGILALLASSVVVNIMFNLTKISDTLGEQTRRKKEAPVKQGKLPLVLFLSSFPVIFGLLFLGDMATSKKKELNILKSADYLVEKHADLMKSLANYSFTAEYRKEAGEILRYLKMQNKNFPSVSLIVTDTVRSKPAYLRLYYRSSYKDTTDRVHCLYACSDEERAHLDKVFQENSSKHLFSAHDGFYELFYPVEVGAKKFVLYFSDRQRYGKSGS